MRFGRWVARALCALVTVIGGANAPLAAQATTPPAPQQPATPPQDPTPPPQPASPPPGQPLGQDAPIGRFIIDVRGAFARHKLEPSTASDLGVVPGNLPSRSFGLVGGAHVYPWRVGKVTFGIGGEMVVARSSKSTQISNTVVNDDGSTTTQLLPSPVVRRHFTSIAPEFSFNFGHRAGYSYISGGMFGRSKLFLDRQDTPVSAAPWRTTINYGAGARWFKGSRLAFSVDARWYSVAAQDADPTINLVAQPRTTLLLLSGGIAIR